MGIGPPSLRLEQPELPFPAGGKLPSHAVPDRDQLRSTETC
jgi:hypothetical protein